MIRLSALLLAAALGAAETTPPAPAPPAVVQQRVFLGLQLDDVPAGVDTPPAVKVTAVTPGANAEVRSVEAFRGAIAALKAGDELALTVVRDGKPLDLKGRAEAPPRPRDVLTDADRLREEAAALKDDVARDRLRSRLEELLALAKEIETGLPQAAAEFKRLYPNGTFAIQLKIDIRSDAGAPAAKPLAPAEAAPADAAKPAAGAKP